MNDISNQRYLVIVSDRKKGKYFTLLGDKIEDKGEVVLDEDVPQKVKAEFTRPGKVDRHIRDHLYHHLRHVGKRAWAYILKKHIRHLSGVIVGSHKELINKTKEFLPVQLKNKVIGEFIASVDFSHDELTNRVISTLRKG